MNWWWEPRRRHRYFLVKPATLQSTSGTARQAVGIVGGDILAGSVCRCLRAVDTGLREVPDVHRYPADYRRRPQPPGAVATKFVNIAELLCIHRAGHPGIIKLNGSIGWPHPGPVRRHCMDIVETGYVLRKAWFAGGDGVHAHLGRFIANKASYQFKHRRMDEMLEKLRAALAAREK